MITGRNPLSTVGTGRPWINTEMNKLNVGWGAGYFPPSRKFPTKSASIPSPAHTYRAVTSDDPGGSWCSCCARDLTPAVTKSQTDPDSPRSLACDHHNAEVTEVSERLRNVLADNVTAMCDAWVQRGSFGLDGHVRAAVWAWVP